MGKFALPKWESNEEGDELCNNLFKIRTKNKTKGKLQNGGKIIKAKLKKAKVDIEKKLGENARNIKSKVDVRKKEILSNLRKPKTDQKICKVDDSSDTPDNSKKRKKKAKKSPNIPNLTHLKTIIESKLKSEEDTKNLVSEDGNETVKESSSIKTNKKKKPKKRNLKHLEKDISNQIDSNLIKMQQKKNLNVNEEKSQNGKKSSKNSSLRERMMAKLKASRFRYLNEQLYSSPSKDALDLFNKDPDSFKAYHEGFRQQVNRWPVNPVDVIIKSLKQMNKNYVVSDFGCGDAKIAQEVQQKVHSFDLVATNERVTPCDMSKVPLSKESVDVAVFCLSLMGTNLQDYLKEANRVLKIGGILKIAEVESRFENVDEFIKGVQHFGFQNVHKDLTHNIFYFMDFKKISNVKKTKGLPTLSLNPCLYKKR